MLDAVLVRLGAQNWNNEVLFRYRVSGDARDVATLAQKIDAEKRAREMLEEGGLPKPDYVEYGFTCIRLFFARPKVVLVIDIDEPETSEGLADAEIR